MLPPSAAFSFLAQNAVGLNLWILARARLPTKIELSPAARPPVLPPSALSPSLTSFSGHVALYSDLSVPLFVIRPSFFPGRPSEEEV